MEGIAVLLNRGRVQVQYLYLCVVIFVQSLIWVIKASVFYSWLRGNLGILIWCMGRSNWGFAEQLLPPSQLATVAFLPDVHWRCSSPRGQESYVCRTVSWPHPKAAQRLPLLVLFPCILIFWLLRVMQELPGKKGDGERSVKGSCHESSSQVLASPAE